MTYRHLAETFEIISKYNGGMDGECFEIWAEHDEWGVEFQETPSAEDLRKLQKMGWLLGSDSQLSRKDARDWAHSDVLTDEELVSLFENYHGIYKYA